MTILEFYILSGYLQWAGSLIIAVSCFYQYKSRPPYIKILAYYGAVCVSVSLAQKISEIVFANVGINTMGTAFVLLEAWFFGLFFYYAVDNNSFKKGVFISTTLYTLFYFVTFLFFIDRSFSLVRFGRDFLMICYAIAYFYYLIRKLPEENLLNFPMFWINTAIIFFFSGTFTLSFFRDYIVTVLKNDTSGFWAFRNCLRLAFCFVVSYAAWLNWYSIKKNTTLPKFQ